MFLDLNLKPIATDKWNELELFKNDLKILKSYIYK
jgi:hypothetical protein